MKSGRTVGALLAGGQSKRFGTPKAFAMLGDRPLIRRVLEAHLEAFERVLVVTNTPEQFASLKLPMTADIFAGAGPLAGVHAALRWARGAGAEGICCTPCDAPFTTPALLRLLERSSEAGGFLAIVPCSDGPLGFEPLFAWYSVEAVGLVQRRLEAGETSMKRFVEAIPSVRMLSLPEVAVAGDPGWLFHNVNTRDDLEAARGLLEGAREETGSDAWGGVG